MPFKISDHGYPVTHRKIGLSKGNEKIVYEGWLKMEFKDFKNFIDDYLCMKKKLCTKNNNMQDILIKLKDENEILKEEFLIYPKSEFNSIWQYIIKFMYVLLIIYMFCSPTVIYPSRIF